MTFHTGSAQVRLFWRTPYSFAVMHLYLHESINVCGHLCFSVVEEYETVVAL